MPLISVESPAEAFGMKAMSSAEQWIRRAMVPRMASASANHSMKSEHA
jgi:hypothetical protein